MRRFRSEAELIDKIKRRFRVCDGDNLVCIGDDAAVIKDRAGRVRLLTTDMLVEGVHFSSAFATPYDTGRKAMAVNISDIAAMGGRPARCVLSLAAPQSRQASLWEVTRGITDESRRFGVQVVGGDISTSREGLVINIALEGYCPAKQVVLRSTAKLRDAVYLTGHPGRSALGLELLKKGFRLDKRRLKVPRSGPSLKEPLQRAARRALRAHLRPEPNVRTGRELAGKKLATAMIDTSDGLSRDLYNLCRASRVGAQIDHRALSGDAWDERLAHSLDLDMGELKLHGGEDYGLLFTVNPDNEGSLDRMDTNVYHLRKIGRITRAKAGLNLSLETGKLCVLPDRGWDHFHKV
ncbi:thiamine-phosphate kinase [Acidobacteriota bacterium]